MQYLTKSFYSKKYTERVYNEQSKNMDKYVKNCVDKLNKWLSKPNQQDVKVDDFSINTVTIHEWVNISQYATVLTIIYHHE